MSSERDWENRCRRCGRCCYEKIEHQGEVIYTDVPCEKFDVRTRLCTVYALRNLARPGCVPITPELAAKGFLPADCPYVEGIADYQAPTLWEEEGG